MIRDLVGVIIWTEDVARLAAFYRDVLWLPVHSERPDFIAFDLPHGRRLSIGRHSGVRGQSQDPYRIMLNLGVDDIHAVHRALRQRGVPFLRPPEQEHWGGWVATLTDPDGNILQLFQTKAESGQANDGVRRADDQRTHR
ncbi:MAG: VOC family protein [Chloroflexi bacterium]|nr:VOC family protein [Chloroflexota bacterium]